MNKVITSNNVALNLNFFTTYFSIPPFTINWNELIQVNVFVCRPIIAHRGYTKLVNLNWMHTFSDIFCSAGIKHAIALYIVRPKVVLGGNYQKHEGILFCLRSDILKWKYKGRVYHLRVGLRYTSFV